MMSKMAMKQLRGRGSGVNGLKQVNQEMKRTHKTRLVHIPYRLVYTPRSCISCTPNFQALKHSCKKSWSFVRRC